MFDEKTLETIESIAVDEIATLAADHTRCAWIQVYGLGDIGFIKRLAEILSLHPLTIEDVIHTTQRPKVEFFDDHWLTMLRLPVTTEIVSFEQVTFFVSHKLVISIQESGRDVFSPVENRLRAGGARIRKGNASYLAYALIDAVVDYYYPAVDVISDQLDSIEERVFDERQNDQLLGELQLASRETLRIRRALNPLQETLKSLSQGIEDKDLRPFLRDTQDHVTQLLEVVENHRELSTNLMNLHISLLSQRMNEVMKVLTVMSTIFIPLGFIAGLYGMNFDTQYGLNMPELGLPFGYPLALGLMAAVALGMLGYFKRKGWF
ncbi:MAG: magnesium/cobalt transporter CorA [Myxococcales bacterium]|nr:magnesium/cobalt transporter CorA [Myxococcales bacterium]